MEPAWWNRWWFYPIYCDHASMLFYVSSVSYIFYISISNRTKDSNSLKSVNLDKWEISKQKIIQFIFNKHKNDNSSIQYNSASDRISHTCRGWCSDVELWWTGERWEIGRYNLQNVDNSAEVIDNDIGLIIDNITTISKLQILASIQRSSANHQCSECRSFMMISAMWYACRIERFMLQRRGIRNRLKVMFGLFWYKVLVFVFINRIFSLVLIGEVNILNNVRHESLRVLGNINERRTLMKNQV